MAVMNATRASSSSVVVPMVTRGVSVDLLGHLGCGPAVVGQGLVPREITGARRLRVAGVAEVHHLPQALEEAVVQVGLGGAVPGRLAGKLPRLAGAGTDVEQGRGGLVMGLPRLASAYSG